MEGRAVVASPVEVESGAIVLSASELVRVHVGLAAGRDAAERPVSVARVYAGAGVRYSDR